jgi:hypothetical protein
MPYLALLYADADAAPGASDAGRWRLGADALQIGPGRDAPRSCPLPCTRVAGLAGLQWIEARDMNEALRIASRIPLPPDAVLELHSLERADP